jgi:hypothetical protein
MEEFCLGNDDKPASLEVGAVVEVTFELACSEPCRIMLVTGDTSFKHSRVPGAFAQS